MPDRTPEPDTFVSYATGYRYRVVWVDPRTAQVWKQHVTTATPAAWERVTDFEEVEHARRVIQRPSR